MAVPCQRRVMLHEREEESTGLGGIMSCVVLLQNKNAGWIDSMSGFDLGISVCLSVSLCVALFEE